MEPVNPFYNLYSAITRSSIKHPELDTHNANEAFLLEDALNCYTTTNDWIDRMEPSDDYIVVNKNIFTTKPNEWLDINVEQVVINNEIVYIRTHNKED